MSSTTIPQPGHEPDLDDDANAFEEWTYRKMRELELRIDQLVLDLNRVKTELRPK